MKENLEKFVLPGDKLSTAEEYVPGKNTVETNGLVISLVPGIPEKNERELIISVKFPKTKIRAVIGDIVYGQVTRSDSRQTIVSIAGLGREGKIVDYQAEGYIRNMNDDRRDDRFFQSARIGDIIRAKVIRVGQNLELTMHGNNLGVLLTRCGKCRNYLVLKDGKLYCENCQRTEARKFAPDYGTPVP